ncbi:MAG: haloacid dehalogenase [Cycloclasticus sp.]|nr:MAG: haloacid dehalogenase [Cycloclasticus sp.]
MRQTDTANPIKAVLFDLDGALIDTAPDLANALNAVLKEHKQEPLPYERIRPMVSNGANGLIKLGFGDSLSDAEHEQIKAELIACYQQNIADKSALFNGLEDALLYIENRHIAWGIVTNKPEYLTQQLLKEINFNIKPQTVVCGDQVSSPKPHPESIYLACKQLGVLPENAIYIGDAERDIRAGNLAGLTTIACAYGYVQANDDIKTWQADEIVATSIELVEWIKEAC